MVESAVPITLAAILVTGGLSLFTGTKDSGCNCTTLSSFLFLTAVFAWLSTQNTQQVFPCELPALALFLIEFLVSLFVFEVALRIIWDPMECYLTQVLPAACGSVFSCGGVLSVLCSGLLYVALVYFLAIGILWSVLKGYGVIGTD